MFKWVYVVDTSVPLFEHILTVGSDPLVSFWGKNRASKSIRIVGPRISNQRHDLTCAPRAERLPNHIVMLSHRCWVFVSAQTQFGYPNSGPSRVLSRIYIRCVAGAPLRHCVTVAQFMQNCFRLNQPPVFLGVVQHLSIPFSHICTFRVFTVLTSFGCQYKISVYPQTSKSHG